MGIALKSLARDRGHVVMQQTSVQQLGDHELKTARRVEVVHVSEAVWIDLCQERNRFGQLREIFEVEDDPRRTGHRRQVQNEVR